jgi:ABC-type amino acid transport/signal transduction systems, periplasmic component/domain
MGDFSFMNVKKIISFALVLSFTAALFTGCVKKSAAGDDKSLDKIKQKGTFVLGLDSAFPPMGFEDEKGNIVGFDIDVAQEVSKKLGVTLKTQPIDWNAKEQELSTGKIDCIWNGFSVNDERQKNLTLTEPYMDNHMAIVVLNNSGIKTLADLKGKKLGLQGGSSAADALDSKDDFKKSLGKVVEFKDNLTALMDLEAKGVDAVLMDDVVANYDITKNKKNFVILNETLATEEYAIGLRKGEVQLKDGIEKALKELKADGTLTKISNKWFGKDVITLK